MRKSKQSTTKLSKTKLNTIDIDKVLRFLALLSGNVSKYEFLTGKDIFPEKTLVKKSCRNRKI